MKQFVELERGLFPFFIGLRLREGIE